AVKAPVYSMAKLLSVDAVLRQEMKATGEAMGIAEDLASAHYKAFLSTMDELPPDGGALCSIADADKAEALPVVAALRELGLKIFATAGTARFLSAAGVEAVGVATLSGGDPTVNDVISSGTVALVVYH